MQRVDIFWPLSWPYVFHRLSDSGAILAYMMGKELIILLALLMIRVRVSCTNDLICLN